MRLIRCSVEERPAGGGASEELQTFILIKIPEFYLMLVLSGLFVKYMTINHSDVSSVP